MSYLSTATLIPFNLLASMTLLGAWHQSLDLRAVNPPPDCCPHAWLARERTFPNYISHFDWRKHERQSCALYNMLFWLISWLAIKNKNHGRGPHVSFTLSSTCMMLIVSFFKKKKMHHQQRERCLPFELFPSFGIINPDNLPITWCLSPEGEKHYFVFLGSQV